MTYETLPRVIPLATLFGEHAPPGVWLPTLDHLLMDAILVGGDAEVRTHANFEYLMIAGNVLEHHCLIRSFAGGLWLRFMDFCKQAGAEVLSKHEETLTARLPMAGGFWERFQGKQGGLEIHLHTQLLPETQMTEVAIRMQIYGSGGKRMVAKLAEVGPALIEKMREYFRVDCEQRAAIRCTVALPVQVHPVFPDLELGDVVAGETIDISLQGIRIRLPVAIATEQIYFTLPSLPNAAPFAVLARILRNEPHGEGSFAMAGSFKRRKGSAPGIKSNR